MLCTYLVNVQPWGRFFQILYTSQSELYFYFWINTLMIWCRSKVFFMISWKICSMKSWQTFSQFWVFKPRKWKFWPLTLLSTNHKTVTDQSKFNNVISLVERSVKGQNVLAQAYDVAPESQKKIKRSRLYALSICT